MAIGVVVPDRIPLKNAELEYERAPKYRKQRRPGFNRARLLDLTDKSVEIAAREAFEVGEQVSLKMHVKGVKNFLSISGEVKKRSTRVNILKQPAFAILIDFGPLKAGEAKKLSWARDQLVSRQGPVRLRRKEERDETADTTVADRAASAPEAAARVKRPVALLELIDGLDKFEVTGDLIMAVIEAAEAGMDVEVLYPKRVSRPLLQEEEEVPEEELEAEVISQEGPIRPMNVYRIARDARLHFSDAAQPVGPASELIYLSRLKTPKDCFAVVLERDNMQHPGEKSFKRGSILIFSAAERVNSGDFAFVKTRSADEFAQIFFDKDAAVRIRPLNPRYHERVVRRSEIHFLCKLIGHYEDMA